MNGIHFKSEMAVFAALIAVVMNAHAALSFFQTPVKNSPTAFATPLTVSHMLLMNFVTSLRPRENRLAAGVCKLESRVTMYAFALLPASSIVFADRTLAAAVASSITFDHSCIVGGFVVFQIFHLFGKVFISVLLILK